MAIKAVKKVKVNDRPQDMPFPKSRIHVDRGPVQRMGIDQKVRFYPSGLTPSDMGAYGIWMKPKTKLGNEFKVLDSSLKGIHLDTPDRELFMVMNALDMDQDRPFGDGWTQFTSFNTTHHTGNDLAFDRFMINPSQMGRLDRNHLNLRVPGKLGSTSQISLSDSGGFQLRSGNEDFIDPQTLATFYNTNVDEGMTLDIPCGGTPDALRTECMKIQILNGKLLKEETGGDVALSNIVHGIEVDEMKTYRRGVEDADPDWDMVSFPSSMQLPPLKQMDRLAYLLSSGQQYAQYHMLGLFSFSTMILIMRMVHKLAKAGREIFVTSDATTAYVSGKWRVYHVNATQYASIERRLIGTVSTGGQYSNPYRVLPCSCEVCSTLKYTDTLGLISALRTPRMLVRHNEINYSNWLSMMNIYAKDMDDKDYRELTLSIVGSQQKMQMVLGLEYIDILLNEGYARAHKRFQHVTSQMFHSAPEEMFEPQEVETSETAKMRAKLLWAVVERYQHFYATGKVPTF